MTPTPEEPVPYGFLHGLAFVILGHVFSIALKSVTGGLSLMVIGLFQLVYVIPITLIALARGRTAVAQGALVAAGLTIILNGVWCAGILGAFRRR